MLPINIRRNGEKSRILFTLGFFGFYPEFMEDVN
nr:MAG TPA: hypothetical protein [Caudoviricetes sp.]